MDLQFTINDCYVSVQERPYLSAKRLDLFVETITITSSEFKVLEKHKNLPNLPMLMS